MDNVFVYYVPLPDGIDEAVLPCFDGYTIYINSRQSSSGMERAYKHALDHIQHNDFEKFDIQEIENDVDRKTRR